MVILVLRQALGANFCLKGFGSVLVFERGQKGRHQLFFSAHDAGKQAGIRIAVLLERRADDLGGVLPGKKHLMLQPRIVLKETIDDYIFDPTLSYQFLK